MLSALNLESTFKKVANQLKRAGGGARFFNTQGKRGESVELHQDLNSSDRDRQKNALKRIIANMTLGRDVSQLFADVVKLGQTPNLEVKKLVYLYVLNNAKLQPEKALMAVNTFLQDATHQSPIVRALALRTMLCLRVDAVIEYTITPLVAALTTVGEADAYVRKTAAIGVGKIFHQNPAAFENHGLMQHLTNLLSDTFPIVSSNAAAVISEIISTPNAPAFEMKKEFVGKLLNALADCTEWGQVYVLEALTLYRAPAEELENLTERVLPRLNHTNCAVVLASIKAMVSFIVRMPTAARAPYVGRINAALLTLAKSDSEAQYVVCRNAHMLLSVFPELLAENFDSFFIRFSDPLYVKFEKLRLLLRLVSPSSAPKVVKELVEYSNEIDPVFVSEVVHAAALVAVKVESVAERCAELIKDIAARHREALPVAVIAAKDVLRRYPNLVIELLPPLVELGADTVEHEEARSAFVWMLGEFSDVIERGAELVDALVDTFGDQGLPIQRALLTAVIKHFLANPAKHERMVMRVLDAAMRCSSNPDLRDRATFYYRLLQRGIGVAKMSSIVLGRKVPADVDKLMVEGMTTNEMLRSLNTAAAVYAKPPRKFVPAYGAHAAVSAEDDEDEVEEPSTPADSQPKAGDKPAPAAAPAGAAEAAKPAAPAAPHVDPMDSLFGSGPAAPAAGGAAAAPTAAAPKSADPFDDMFGGGPAKPAAPAAQPTSSPAATSSMPPQVLSAAANGGVAAHAAFEAPTSGGSHPVQLAIALVNSSASPVSAVQLQLNKSRFSLAPGSSLTLPQPIAVGATWSAVVPIKFADGHESSTQGVSIQCGLSVNGRVVTFALDLPPNLLLNYGPDISKQDFARLWQSMDAASEQRFNMGALPADVEHQLAQRRITVVARVTDRLFCTASLHNGVVALVEVVANSGDVTVRSANIREASDIVKRAMPSAGAPKKSVPSVDDLFA